MGLVQKLLLPAVAGAAYAVGRKGKAAPQPAVAGGAWSSTTPHGSTAQGGSSAGSSTGRPQSGGAKEGGAEDGGAKGGAKGGGQGALPGGQASKPTEIPAAGWKQILKRSWQESKDDNVSLMAAGIAYYAFLALFPALIAAVTLYGLIADPAEVTKQVKGLTDSLPADAASLITTQLKSVASGSGGALSFGLVISVLGALFSASGGVGNLMKAINLAYDEDETRGFLKLRGTALLLTLGAILFMIVAVLLIAVLPATLSSLGLGSFGKIAVSVLRWVALVGFVLVALAVLYRYAPDRDNPKFAWVGLGSIVATVLWIVGSAAFSIYVSNFGKYGKTYGALAGVVVLLLWMYLTAYIVLLGAEINSETEAQTVRDTTEGPEQPMGDRRAVKADTVAQA